MNKDKDREKENSFYPEPLSQMNSYQIHPDGFKKK